MVRDKLQAFKEQYDDMRGGEMSYCGISIDSMNEQELRACFSVCCHEIIERMDHTDTNIQPTKKSGDSIKESIFENGYLKSEFINPNYRGNWRDNQGDVIIGIANGMFTYADDNLGLVSVRFLPTFNQFTSKDIPIGELCWFGNKVGDHFVLRPLDSGHFHKTKTYDWWVIPYLIAETEKDAERLKDWSEV